MDTTRIDDMLERNSMNVTLHDVDPTALRNLIDYAYSGEITITEDNVQVRTKGRNNFFFLYFFCFNKMRHSNLLNFLLKAIHSIPTLKSYEQFKRNIVL